MAQNDNQQQENRAFKKEDAYETLGIINTWIGNMDTKVSFALALAGVVFFRNYLCYTKLLEKETTTL